MREQLASESANLAKLKSDLAKIRAAGNTSPESNALWRDLHKRIGDAERAQRLGHEAAAVSAYKEALSATSPETDAETWAMLQHYLGYTYAAWANVSTGGHIAIRRKFAVQAYCDALTVYTKAALPQNWAMTQNNLANALGRQASASDGEERRRLLQDALECCRNAQSFYTKEHFPRQHANIQRDIDYLRAELAKFSSQ